MGKGGSISGKAVLEELKSVRADDGATCLEAEAAIAEGPEKHNALTLITANA